LTTIVGMMRRGCELDNDGEAARRGRAATRA
jgi:hypothetical protein